MKHVDHQRLAALAPSLRIANPAFERDRELVARGIKRWPDKKLTPFVELFERTTHGGWVPFGAEPAPTARWERPATWLRPYQADAVDACLAWDCGVVVAPCGAGKTQVGCGIIAAAITHLPSLVLVHTRDLARQWRDRLKSLGLPSLMPDGTSATAAQLRRGEVEGWPGTYIVTVQTLVRLAGPLPQFGVVIVDEAHHTPATTFTAVLRRLRPRYLYGLTATPEREDGMTPVMYAHLGPVRYTVDRQHLVELGQSLTPRVVQVQTRCWTDESEFGRMVNALTSDAKRDAIILREVLLRAKASPHPQLVLTSRVEHAETFAAACRDAGLRAMAVTGQTRERDAALDAVRMGSVDVLVATQLADEGLDIPTLDTLHLAAPSRAAARVEQRVGRIMRPAPGKSTPVVYDYVDDDSLMISQWRSRMRVYRNLGVKLFERR